MESQTAKGTVAQELQPSTLTEHVSLLLAKNDHSPDNNASSAEGAQDDRQHADSEKSISNRSSLEQAESLTERMESSLIASDTSAQPEKDAWKRKARSFFSHSFTRLGRFLTDTWWPEALALAFSSGCLVAIAGFLISYHGHQIPELPDGLTLNAIISTLAVGSKSALIFAVTTTMSQNKWCWFHTRTSDQYRRLQDMQVMDDAVRGPLGSVTLLFKKNILSLGSIGAVIVVLALAFDPFVQQVISYPVRAANISSEATIRQAIAVPYSVVAFGPSTATEAVYSGLYAARSSFQRTPFCPTGNCTWAPFQSAEWCSKCGDVSEQLHSGDCNFTIPELLDEVKQYNISERNCTFSLAAGNHATVLLTAAYSYSDDDTEQFSLGFRLPSVSSLTGIINTSLPADVIAYLQGTFEILGETNPLIALLSLTTRADLATSGTESSATLPQLLQATACILTPCLRRYSISVTNGKLHSEVAEEDHGILTPVVSTNPFTPVGICWKPEALRHQNVSTPVLYGPGDTVDDLYTNPANMAWCQPSGDPRRWTDDVLRPLSGDTGQGYNVFVHSDPGNNVYVESWNSTYSESSSLDEMSAVLQMVFGDGPGPLVDTYIPGITDALTHNNFQFDSASISSYGTPSNVSSIVKLLPGTVWGQQVFVHVRWAWLTLPIVLTIGAAAFLAITAYQTRRQHLPLWKSSTMAMLYHGLGEGLIDTGRDYEVASDMDSMARGVYVRLAATDEGGGRLHLRP